MSEIISRVIRQNEQDLSVSPEHHMTEPPLVSTFHDPGHTDQLLLNDADGNGPG